MSALEENLKYYVTQLRDLSYDTGYLSAKAEDGKPIDKANQAIMIKRRNDTYTEIMARIDELSRVLDTLQESIGGKIEIPSNWIFTKNIETK